MVVHEVAGAVCGEIFSSTWNRGGVDNLQSNI
jgi:hypothetical protein